MRISTTVDIHRWHTARSLLEGSNSRVVDAALEALIEKLEGEREAAALTSHPYEEDPDLNWDAPLGPPIPYDGPVPTDVLRLAERRRKAGRR